MNADVRISIIVPNYNGAATLEQTLLSVLEQDYPAVELLVVDAASTDGSVDIIKRYADRITWWTSEPDNGQASAINKGFARATGQLLNWLNSDDRLAPGALRVVADAFTDPTLDVFVGVVRHDITFENIVCYRRPSMRSIDDLPLNNAIGQPACFYRKRLLDRSPPVDESFHYAMDIDLWCHFIKLGAKWKVTDHVLAVAIEDGNNKMSTGGAKIASEMERVYRRYVPNERIPLTTWYRRLIYPMDKFRGRKPGPVKSFTVKAAKATVFALLAPFYGGFARTRSINWSVYV